MIAGAVLRTSPARKAFRFPNHAKSSQAAVTQRRKR